MPDEYDVAIVGAGILGLGHALAAHDRGLRVVVGLPALLGVATT
jgi:glycerol-3-phosphate dehydrogenase